MKKVIIFLSVLLVIHSSDAQSQKFRSGVFLHHSTGNNIWENNGSSVTVPDEIVKYNSAHGFSGEQAVSMTEMWWPSGDNEWYTWYRILRNEETSDDIRPILQSNKIVVIKSCFPSSSIESYGTGSDTSDLYSKTVYNYKYLWRKIVRIMEKHPQNYFAIWTNAPLVAEQTDDTEAALSDQFCTWAKDTLAAGLDDEFGVFPKNVYVFDFFHKLADSSGKLPNQYAVDLDDSHPNTSATALVAPQFVDEIFNAAIDYESMYSGERDERMSNPEFFLLGRNYPNPFNPITIIPFTVKEPCRVVLKIFSIQGKLVSIPVDRLYQKGEYKVKINFHDMESGLYIYRIKMKNFIASGKMILLE
ncbi:T9SS type A sorting domain-containing protein [bacterium]|nr:T9SS type A sorting domain-containing protein [bacterium]